MNLVRVETLCCLSLIVLAGRSAFRTWGNPATILTGVFWLSLVMQEVLIPDVPFGTMAGVTVIAGSLAVSVGAVLARRKFASPVNTVIEVNPRRERLCTYAIYAVILVALWYTRLVYTTVVVQQNNYVNGIFYREAFSLGVGSGIDFRVGQVMMYVGAVLMALDIAARGFRRWPPLVFTACVAIQSYILSAKAPMLITLALFTSMWIGTRQASVRRIMRGRNVAVFGLILIASFAIVSAVTQRRGGTSDDVLDTIAYSYAGPPSALSKVLDEGFNSEQKGDLVSIGGIRELIGGPQRGNGAGLASAILTQGVYRSNINVYTWYLPLLSDFGPIGMPLLLAALGYWAAIVGQKASRGVATVPALVVFTLLTSLFLWAPILTLTYFNFWFLLLVLAPAFGWLYRTVPPGSRAAQTGGHRARAKRNVHVSLNRSLPPAHRPGLSVDCH